MLCNDAYVKLESLMDCADASVVCLCLMLSQNLVRYLNSVSIVIKEVNSNHNKRTVKLSFLGVQESRISAQHCALNTRKTAPNYSRNINFRKI